MRDPSKGSPMAAVLADREIYIIVFRSSSFRSMYIAHCRREQPGRRDGIPIGRSRGRSGRQRAPHNVVQLGKWPTTATTTTTGRAHRFSQRSHQQGGGELIQQQCRQQQQRLTGGISRMLLCQWDGSATTILLLRSKVKKSPGHGAGSPIQT